LKSSLPKDDLEKHLWREQCQKVHDILWQFWDPIGVSSFDDWPKDEYDRYAGTVVSMLRHGQTAQQIAQYLHQAETEHIGMAGDQARAASVAQMLISLNVGA
jgi:hypothetical protein